MVVQQWQYTKKSLKCLIGMGELYHNKAVTIIINNNNKLLLENLISCFWLILKPSRLLRIDNSCSLSDCSTFKNVYLLRHDLYALKCTSLKCIFQSILTNTTLVKTGCFTPESSSVPLLWQSPAPDKHPETTTGQIWFIPQRLIYLIYKVLNLTDMEFYTICFVESFSSPTQYFLLSNRIITRI